MLAFGEEQAMANPQDPLPQHGAQPSPAPRVESDAGDVMMRAAEIQRAVVVTGIAFAREWVDLMAGYSEQMSKALLDVARDRRTSSDVAANVLDDYRNYVAELAALPRIYGMRFLVELEDVRAGRTTAKKR